MSIPLQTKKQIRGLMQDPKWGALETAFEHYKREHFQESSLKRSNEFETIWNVAFSEGGKYHLNGFINELENNAQYD